MSVQDVEGSVVDSHSTYDAVFAALEAVLLCCVLMCAVGQYAGGTD